ncbi:hypothetical protein [Haloarcula sp. JP-L23]|uniref:hypothetical protein n=1 Tax=Haloarcula sp. JP-L23 TaxID=2716717 RepID=UPI0018785091
MTPDPTSGQKIAALVVVTAIVLTTGTGGFYTVSVLSDSESVVSSFSVGNAGNVDGTAETTSETETTTDTETTSETETTTDTETTSETETTTDTETTSETETTTDTATGTETETTTDTATGTETETTTDTAKTPRRDRD